LFGIFGKICWQKTNINLQTFLAMSELVKKSSLSVPDIFSDFLDNDRFPGFTRFQREFKSTLPSANIRETDKAYKIDLALPGFSRDQINVKVEKGNLIISAEARDEKDEKNERWNRREYYYSSLERSFYLPDDIREDSISAHMENGVLKISMEKLESDGKTFSRDIKVK
jgi:HSP20 family protein